MLGFDVTTGDGPPALAAASRRLDPAARRDWRSSTPSPISCAVAPERRDLGRRRRRHAGAPRALQHLPALARRRARGPAAVVRRPAAAGARPLRRRRRSTRATSSRTPLLRIFVAQQRRDEQLADRARPARRRRRRADDDPGLRETLDRLIERDPAALPGDRQPGPRRCGTAASTARTSSASRAEVVGDDAAARRPRLVGPADRRPDADGRARRLPAAAPADPRRGGSARPTPRRPVPLLEVLTRRYYRSAQLGDVRRRAGRRRRRRAAEYVHDGRTVHVVAVRARTGGLAEALATVGRGRGVVAAPDTVVVDLYLPPRRDQPPTSTRLAGAAVRELLVAADLPGVGPTGRADPPSEAEVRSCSRSGGPTRRRAALLDGVRTPTLRRPARFDEDVKFRGLHPMIARRLQMWRSDELRDQPACRATGDVHLFDCVARDNPSDRAARSPSPRSAT